MQETNTETGALALVGSGEYLDVMLETDLFLINTLGGPSVTQVACIPTASGLEPGMPERWSKLGVAHFTKLGAEAEAVWLVEKEDAFKPEILQILENSNFFYFSGGNPVYLLETVRDTPAWEIISRKHRDGAVLAGCSAGAMAFGSYTINVRSALTSHKPQWLEALGIARGLITLPHFDRLINFMGPDRYREILESAPFASRLLGVDEDTALVRYCHEGTWQWKVIGRQTVSLMNREGQATVYRSGETVNLA